MNRNLPLFSAWHRHNHPPRICHLALKYPNANSTLSFGRLKFGNPVAAANPPSDRRLRIPIENPLPWNELVNGSKRGIKSQEEIKTSLLKLTFSTNFERRKMQTTKTQTLKTWCKSCQDYYICKEAFEKSKIKKTLRMEQNLKALGTNSAPVVGSVKVQMIILYWQHYLVTKGEILLRSAAATPPSPVSNKTSSAARRWCLVPTREPETSAP